MRNVEEIISRGCAPLFTNRIYFFRHDLIFDERRQVVLIGEPLPAFSGRFSVFDCVGPEN